MPLFTYEWLNALLFFTDEFANENWVYEGDGTNWKLIYIKKPLNGF